MNQEEMTGVSRDASVERGVHISETGSNNTPSIDVFSKLYPPKYET